MSDSTSSERPARRGLDTARTGRWRPRAVHWHLSFWTLVAIGLISLTLVLSSMALTGRVVVLPPWVTERVTEKLNDALPSGTVSLARVEAGLTRAGLPRLRLVDVGLRDARGLGLAQLNAVEGSFHLAPALMGRLEPRRLQLKGAQVTLRRLADGSFDLAFGQYTGPSGNLAAMLDAVDALFETGPAASIIALGVSDLTVTLEDARSGRIWQVTDGEVDMQPNPGFTDTTIRFNVFNQTEELASTEFSFRSARDSSEASLAVRFDNAAARDIAAQSPVLAFLQVIDAPIAGALRTSIGPDGSLDDLAGSLQIGAGALSPTPGAEPAAFTGAKVYIDFDPLQQRIDFTGASIESEVGTVEAEGHVYLTDFAGAWPNSLMGQIHFPRARLSPPGVFAAPLDIEGGTADLRVRLAPFRIDIGQAVVFRAGTRYEVSGSVGAGPDGWSLALDTRFDSVARNEALALWPVGVSPAARGWVDANVAAGTAVDGVLAFRKDPKGKLAMNGTFGVENATVRPMPALAPVEAGVGYVTLAPGRFAVTAEAATTEAPDGSILDLSGSSYLIPDVNAAKQRGVVNLRLRGPLRGALSVLAEKPFSVFARSPDGFGADMARGEVAAEGRITFPTKQGGVPPKKVAYDISAALTDVSSDVLIAGKLLTADRLELQASNKRIEVTGPVAVGQARALGTWTMPLKNGRSLPATISGTAVISQQSLNEFGLGSIAEMVTGRSRARFDIALGGPGTVPRLKLSSDLGGLAMSLPGTGWQKPAAETGSLSVEALLGERPEVVALTLDAPGLKAKGSVTTAEGGGLSEARFERVRLGGWLDAPVVLTGRGPGLPVAIAVSGGTIDMRRAAFGTSGGGTAGPRQPLTLAVDRLIVSDSIRLRDLRADLDLAGGLSGQFTGRFFDGNNVEGTVVHTAEGAAFRITSNRAGNVLRRTDIFRKAEGGKLELILSPVTAAGTYEGEFTITNIRVVDAPAMAELLSAVSVIGLIDQLQGDGIRFDEVEGRFRLEPDAVTLYRSAAVGASMGISLDGYYDMAAGQIDMQGVLSPLFIVNAIGRIFSARDGEGLVGFNFTLSGPAEKPAVQVNPLSILTPGVFREIFRRPPPEDPAQKPAE